MTIYATTADPVISEPIILALCSVVFLFGTIDVGMDIVAEWFGHGELERGSGEAGGSDTVKAGQGAA